MNESERKNKTMLSSAMPIQHIPLSEAFGFCAAALAGGGGLLPPLYPRLAMRAHEGRVGVVGEQQKTRGVGNEKAWWSSGLGSWERYVLGPVRRERKAGQPFGFVTVRPLRTVADYFQTVLTHQPCVAMEQSGLPQPKFLVFPSQQEKIFSVQHIYWMFLEHKHRSCIEGVRVSAIIALQPELNFYFIPIYPEEFTFTILIAKPIFFEMVICMGEPNGTVVAEQALKSVGIFPLR